MDDTEVRAREFLMRWLMEFGTDPVSLKRRMECEWYMDYAPGGFPWGVDSLAVCQYFAPRGKGEARHINQAGLDFIKGESL